MKYLNRYDVPTMTNTTPTPRSSWIEATTWTTTGRDAKGMPVGTITIQKNSGDVFTYDDVPLWQYGCLHRSRSVGSYYNKMFRGRGRRVDVPEPQNDNLLELLTKSVAMLKAA